MVRASGPRSETPDRISAMPARSATARRRSGDFVGVADRRTSMTRTGSACAVKITSSSGFGCAARIRSVNASTSSGWVWNDSTASNCILPAAPRCAASMYFLTLSVENCGAIGMPITRVDACRGRVRRAASLMNGFQLRMPTATGMSGPSLRAQRRRLRLGDVGQRRSSADRAVVLAHLVHELVGRRPPAAHQRQILRHLVQRGRSAVRHQENADAGHRAVSRVRSGAGFRVRSFMAAGFRVRLELRTPNAEPRTTNPAPRTLNRFGSCVSSCSRVLMHVARERLHVLDRRRRQDAVTEVEDVARRVRRARQDFVGRGEHAIERAEQQRRIEIALDARDRDRCAPTLRRAACASRRRSRRRPPRAARPRIDPVPTPK